MALASEGLLLGFAQLGVGFAGFAGVIGAFSRLRVHPQATVFRIRALVAVGLAEVIFTLLPNLLAAFGIAEALLWRIVAVLLAVSCTVLLAVLARAIQRLYRSHLVHTQIATWLLEGCAAILIVALYGAALGPFAQQAFGICLATMFFGAVLASHYFLMLVIAIRLDRDEGES